MVNRPRTRRAHHPTLLTAALAIALSAVIAPRNAQAARPALKAYSTRHYIVYTTLDRADAVPFGRHMDLVFDQYRRRFAAFGSADAPPMPLYLFSERAQYLSFLGGHGVDASNSGGMFVVRAGVRGLCTWVNGRGRSVTFDVLEHEGFHQFAYASIGRYLPVWANEGLAQYFEDGVLIGQSMLLGMVNDQRLRIVQAALRRNAPLITLDTLFDMTDANWAHVLSRDPAKSSLLYSYAWSVVYFLIHGEGGAVPGGLRAIPVRRVGWD